MNRLRTYHANVDAVIGYYKQQLVEVRGGGRGWRGEVVQRNTGHGQRRRGTGGNTAEPPCPVAHVLRLLLPPVPQIDGTKSMDEVFGSIEKAIDAASKVAA